MILSVTYFIDPISNSLLFKLWAAKSPVLQKKKRFISENFFIQAEKLLNDEIWIWMQLMEQFYF